jgi:hypothetical protein
MFQHEMIQMNHAFQEAIKALSETLKQLLSAAKIIHGMNMDRHFKDHVRDLAKCFLAQLRYVETAVCDLCAYVKSGSPGLLTPGLFVYNTEVAQNVRGFTTNTSLLCIEIKYLARMKISRCASMPAVWKRKKEQKRLCADDPLTKLPLASSDQVIKVLNKLEHAIKETCQFSIALGLGQWLGTYTPTLAGADVEVITVTAETMKLQVSGLESLV